MVDLPKESIAAAGCVDGWEPAWGEDEIPFGDWDVDDVLAGRVATTAVLADCAAGMPGAGRVLMLTAIDPTTLDGEAQLDYVRALEEQLRWLQGRRVQALAAVAAADTSDDRWSVIDVARLLQLSDGHAACELANAADLAQTLPLTVRALTEGRIGLRSAEAILETSKTVREELHGDLERAVLPRADQQTVPGLRRSLRRASIRLDAEGADKRRRLAYADRHVRRSSLPDGMAQFSALLSAADAEALWRRLDAATALLPATDIRTLDQQRADLLVDAVLSGIPFDALPDRQGRRPTVGVVIELSTLLGLNDNPGDLTGHGAITAQAAREIAADATAEWHRFVTDPVTGHLLDYGTTVYRPPAQLRDFILNRWPTCVHPGCNRPGYRTDLDHRHPAQSGGPTSAANMYPLCRRHHRAKTLNRWTYRRNDKGEIHWTSAGGKTYSDSDTPRWRMPGESPVRRGAEPHSDLPDPRTTNQSQRSQQRGRQATEHPMEPASGTAQDAAHDAADDAANKTGADNQPDGADNQPDGADNQPDGADNQPDGADNQPDGADNQPDGDDRNYPATGPLLRLTDYLDSLPPGVPPF